MAWLGVLVLAAATLLFVVIRLATICGQIGDEIEAYLLRDDG